MNDKWIQADAALRALYIGTEKGIADDVNKCVREFVEQLQDERDRLAMIGAELHYKLAAKCVNCNVEIPSDATFAVCAPCWNRCARSPEGRP